jgi:hypothetical protein
MVDRKRLKNPNGLILGTPAAENPLLASGNRQRFPHYPRRYYVCDPEASIFRWWNACAGSGQNLTYQR